MPVIVVTGPELSDEAAVTGMLTAATTAVGRALTLEPSGVHAMFVLARSAVTGARPVPAWPTAVLYGRSREQQAMDDASEALVAVLAEAWHAGGDEVWVQWMVRR